MYNCMKHHTGSAVARVTNDRAARPHLLSTVENQLGRRRRQLLAITQWNVRTLHDSEAADRPERRTALVAVEPAKYNIDIAAICETKFSESGSFNDLEYSATGKPEGERTEVGVGFAFKNDIVTQVQTLMSRRVLQTRSTRSTTAANKDTCRLLQKRTRALKSDWWERKAVELQRAADRNNMKGFYNGLKEMWEPNVASVVTGAP